MFPCAITFINWGKHVYLCLKFISKSVKVFSTFLRPFFKFFAKLFSTFSKNLFKTWPVSISTDITIKTIGTLISDDSSLTHREIAAHLVIVNGTVPKVCRNYRIVCCLQSHRGKFFCFHMDGSYRCAIHLIDLQLGLRLWNTLFFMPMVLKDF